MSTSDDAVRVAVRVRPLLQREVREGCEFCLRTVEDDNSIVMSNGNSQFTFDHVLGANSTQVAAN